MNNLHFPDAWLEPLGKAFCAEFLEEIQDKILEISHHNPRIFPPTYCIFRSLELVDFRNAKVLILGQDPYHKFEQANGLSFSVDKAVRIPPSLKNIFIELKNDLNICNTSHGDLTFWAEQQVLLLNSVLTVEESRPNSHKKIGWEILTNKIISRLSERGNMIFVLWGNDAQSKIQLIENNNNEILIAPHPSPLSAYKGFIGCQHFSKINQILVKNGLSEINWKLK